MNHLDQELKQFVFRYRRENHDQAKQQADALFKKHPSEIKLFKTKNVCRKSRENISDTKKNNTFFLWKSQ